jgi:hypothetical protein
MTLQHYHILCPIQKHYDIYPRNKIFTIFPNYLLPIT